MKDIFRSGAPDYRSEFRFQSAPPKPQEKPKVTFPTNPKIIENPSLSKDGKHVTKKQPPKGQATLWPK